MWMVIHLAYDWDFGDGTMKKGNKEETYSYPPDKQFIVKVKVSDGKSAPEEVVTPISTIVITTTLDNTKQYQVMEGFGGFGAQDVFTGAPALYECCLCQHFDKRPGYNYSP